MTVAASVAGVDPSATASEAPRNPDPADDRVGRTFGGLGFGRLTAIGVGVAAAVALIVAIAHVRPAIFVVDARAGQASATVPRGSDLPAWLADRIRQCPDDRPAKRTAGSMRLVLSRSGDGLYVDYGPTDGGALRVVCEDGRTVPVPPGGFQLGDGWDAGPGSGSDPGGGGPAAASRSAVPAERSRWRPVVSVTGEVDLGSELRDEPLARPVLTAGTIVMHASGVLGGPPSQVGDVHLSLGDELVLYGRGGEPSQATLVATPDPSATDQLVLALHGTAYRALVLSPGDEKPKQVSIAPSFLARLRLESTLFLLVTIVFGSVDAMGKISGLRRSARRWRTRNAR